MLQPKKKISKRELKEDTLVSSYAKVTKYYGTHKRTISIAITAVVAVVLITAVYLKNRADASEQALARLSQITSFYDNGQYQLAIDGVPARNIAGLKAIAEDGGSSPGGELARFYLANAYLNLGNYDEALNEFKSFSPSGDDIAIARYAGIAACYEAKREYSDAGSFFEKAASVSSTDTRVPEFLASAARAYANAREKEKALDLYRRLKKNHATTPYGRDADRYITQLSM